MGPNGKSLAVAVIATLMVSGCINLKSPPDPTRYYLLNGSDDAESIATDPMNTGPLVRLAPVALDPYLDTPYMVLRLQKHEVQFSDIHRWGENLAMNIRRVLARDLMASGAVRGVETGLNSKADYLIEIQVHRFEGAPPDIARLMATWSMYDADGVLIHSAVHDDRSEGWIFENYQHLAEMLDDALFQMAASIAKKIP